MSDILDRVGLFRSDFEDNYDLNRLLNAIEELDARLDMLEDAARMAYETEKDAEYEAWVKAHEVEMAGAAEAEAQAMVEEAEHEAMKAWDYADEMVAATNAKAQAKIEAIMDKHDNT